MKLSRERLCALLMIAYHALFASGMVVVGNDYISELKALRSEIKQQSERINKTLNTGEKALTSAGKACDTLGKKLRL